MRIIFIPGFGEDVSIYEKLHPLLEGKKVFVDNWSLLAEVPDKDLNAAVYAQFLVDRFSITNKDLLIGHSMGGWMALHIKERIGCTIVQVASWTDQRKVFGVLFPRVIIYWLAKRGLVFSDLSRQFMVWLHYRNKPSRHIFNQIVLRLQKGNRQIVVKQLKVVFNPVRSGVAVTPDQRIHALADRITKFPKEAFVKVPGDHLSLYTYPEAVSKPINELLEQLGY